MNVSQKFVLTMISGAALFAAADAYAASEVIYKIHDITPVKQDNEIVSCDFSVTFFNRATQTVSNLSLDIGWKDEVIEDRIKEEKKEKIVDENDNFQGYSGRSKTEEFTSKVVSTNLSVPPLLSEKQISVKGSVKTNRCFLLLQEPEIVVRSCKFGVGNMDTNAGVCKRLFKFVNPQQGEYYTDFKTVSYDIQKKEDKQHSLNEQKDLDKLYNNALSSVKRISQTLNSMQ